MYCFSVNRLLGSETPSSGADEHPLVGSLATASLFIPSHGGSGQWYSRLTASTMRFTAPELSFALIMMTTPCPDAA